MRYIDLTAPQAQINAPEIGRARMVSVTALAATLFVLNSTSTVLAGARVAVLSPVPLQTLKGDTEAQKLTDAIKGAIDRCVPGVQPMIISNDPNKSSAAAFVLDGKGLAASGLVSASPPPSTDYMAVAANPNSSNAPDSVTIVGKNIKITSVGVSAAKPETNLGAPDFFVEPTLVIDPSSSSNLTLYIFVTRHDGGITKSSRWQTTGGAADLNKTLSQVCLSTLFEESAPTGLGTVLVIPQRSAELAYAPRIQNRLGNAYLSTLTRNDISLQNTRSELAIACAGAGARNILAWGVETDKETKTFGFSGYHARVSFDLLNCLPTDYNPPSFATGLYRSKVTNLPGVIASIGAILQTATRMTIAPIANVLSGSTITAIFPQADDAQNSQKVVNMAIDGAVDKLCDYLAAEQRVRDVSASPSVKPASAADTAVPPSPDRTPAASPGGCAKYTPKPPAVTALVTPMPTYPPGASPAPSPSATPAFFIINDGKGQGAAIRIRLEDSALIKQASELIGFPSKAKKHIQGKIVLGKISYEQGWGFYIDPASISFFDVSANSTCDTSLDWIKMHKDSIGGEGLPGGIWCSWESSLRRDTQVNAKTGDSYRSHSPIKKHVTASPKGHRRR